MRAQGTDFTGLAYLAVIAGTAWIGYQVYRSLPSVKKAVTGAVDAVNPANQNNVVNRGVTAIVQAATGTPNTLGTWLAEKFDPTTRAADQAMRSVQTPAAIQLWTNADQEDAEIGAAMQGWPLWSAADQEDADQGYYARTGTAGGASLAYRIKR